MTKHTLSVLVENKPGVLARVAGLFSRRGFNIDSLAVGETEHPEVSRITIVVNAEDSPLEQVTKQLNKLVNVLKIVELEADCAHRQHDALVVDLVVEGVAAVGVKRRRIVRRAHACLQCANVDLGHGAITPAR